MLCPFLHQNLPVGGEGVDGNVMPMVGPQAIPEPQKQVAGSNGENIQIEKKVTSELEAETVKICWNCHAPKETTKLFKCKGCHKARYCGEKCQRKDWERHGGYCAIVMERKKERTCS